MRDPIETALFAAGMLLAVLFAVAVCFSRRRAYSAWAKVGSVIASVAGLSWGAIGLVLSRPHLAVSRHVYYAVVHTKGLFGGICLGFVVSILLARPYQKIEMHTATTSKA